MFVTEILITVIVAYIAHKIYVIRKNTKWADNLPGRNDWFFYTLIFKVQGASPAGKSFFFRKNKKKS